MRSQLLNADPPITYGIALETGEKVMSTLTRFLTENKVDTAWMTAIGSFRRALVGYFDWDRKQCRRIPVDQQVEALSLPGDVAIAEGKPSLHLHAVLGRSDGTVIGGHLLEAEVRPTLEVIPTQPPSYLRKRKDPITGLALIVSDHPIKT